MPTFLALTNTRMLLPPPPLPPVPRSALTAPAPAASIPDDDLPRQLHSFRRSFSRKEYTQECIALDRLRYKNSNQHRSAPHFRKLLAVRRLLARVQACGLDKTLETLLADMHPNATKRYQGRWEYLPARPALSFILIKLAGGHRLMTALLTALADTYNEFKKVAAQSYFMAVSIIAMAACARLHLMTRVRLRDVEECYGLLYAYMTRVPRVKGDDQVDPFLDVELPSAINAETFGARKAVLQESPGMKDADMESTHQMDYDDAEGDDSNEDGNLHERRTDNDGDHLISAISDEFWAG
ncbi:hypothetical protein DFJ77DRAFT_162143 [Powellomyces hirtus]|nr:hypothetical protein DFJ77DRAFT_162143 [Powellomyces hirtus]